MRHRRRLLLTAEVFFVTVGPWIFALVGGIFLSASAANHSLGELIGVGSFWIGALLLLVGVGPLAVSTTRERWQREENESKHEREFATNQLAAFSIAKLPVSDQLTNRIESTRMKALAMSLQTHWQKKFLEHSTRE